MLGPLGVTTKVASSWWLAGGVSAASCVAAYQAKGAASYAASLSNLNDPGTRGLYSVNTTPSWSAATGWGMMGQSGYFRMTSGWFPTQSMTVLIQVANASTSSMQFCGASGGSGARASGISINNTGAFADYYNWGSAAVGGVVTAGNIAIAGKTVFRNGSSVGTISAGTGTNIYDWYWGCENFAGTAHGGGTHTLIAMACYDAVLTNAQVVAVTAAMAAL